jgi:hypothetical protein
MTTLLTFSFFDINQLPTFQNFIFLRHLAIEIGLEQAPFFSSFEHVKSLLIMGPNYTKNVSLIS